jgi:hypothetical protein
MFATSMSTIAVFGGTGETGKEVVFQVSNCCPFLELHIGVLSRKRFRGHRGDLPVC